MRVWWIPQVGAGATFYVPVRTPEEGKYVIDILSAYDMFQYKKNIKGDYCNTGGIQIYEDGEWQDWYYDDNILYIDNIDEYVHNLSTNSEWLENVCEYMFEQ